MNDKSPDDSTLSSFEEQIAKQSPSVPAGVRDELLYRCAFAAGQKAASGSTTLWKRTAVILCVLLAGVLVPYAIPRPTVIDQAVVPDSPVPERFPVSEPIMATLEARSAKDPRRFNLDHWKVPKADTNSLERQLAELSELDAHQRSLTVRSLTHAALLP